MSISAHTKTYIDKQIVGKYYYDQYHDGYPVYKKLPDLSGDVPALYLFYDLGRWILEKQVRGSKTAEGIKTSGIIIYRGEYICPDLVGKRWTYRSGTFMNITSIDASIDVSCSLR